MLRPREAIGLTRRYLKEEISHWHGDKDPEQSAWATNGSQWHDFMFQRSCQKLQRMCVKDGVEKEGGRPVLRKSGSGEEMTTRNMLLTAINSLRT